jgi:hypothetical protein
MSKLFFDHLLVLDEVDVEIRKTASSKEEREDLEVLVDEIVHHRILCCLLTKLPREHHEEFLSKFHQAPFDGRLIDYLNGKTGEDIEKTIKKEIESIQRELLSELRTSMKRK